MDYRLYTIYNQPEMSDIIMAFLGELPFDMFQDHAEGLEAYIPLNADTDEIHQEVERLKEQFSFTYKVEDIQGQNWNKEWESNFDTVLVDDFCGIRADFHPAFANVTHEIVINPKMAFGTGHHSTTYMMIELMKNISFEGKSVLDYGSGTGILAILAAKMGCTDIDAVEIEDAAFLNMKENMERNEASHVRCFHGTLDTVPNRKYDIILANINRNVILDSLSQLSQILHPSGILITSGYIEDDKSLMEKALSDNKFWSDASKQRKQWLATQSFKRY